MKKLTLLLIMIFSINLSGAENEDYFTVCSDYAHKLATYYELAYGTDYYGVYFSVYGDCIEAAY
ncbi:hypothetical protein Murru_1253 [Allomuricauda ruestringensis DSM 13258]|uniref:Uncharacterized protein n=2 Tax=Flagellimonas TaxID=444459 RepID=G2PNW1_ALLRU|nr:hypothetical protein Murru_1253 [Allomuricauda ruestringensis DSM 13258]